MKRCVLAAALVLVAGASVGMGQTLAPAPLVAQPAADTLIKMGPAGLIERLAITPEEAAFNLVGPDKKEREAADKLLAERAAIMDKVMADHVPVLLKFQGFRESDSMRERMQAATELARAMGPMTEYNKAHGSLMAQLSAVVTPEKGAKMKQLVDDYRQALMHEAEETVQAKKNDPDPAKRQSAIKGREALLAIGQEVQRSYERQLETKAAAVNDMVARVGVTPEQDAKVRALAADLATKSQGKPTATQRRELFDGVMKVLDDDQKMVLLGEVYGVDSLAQIAGDSPKDPPAPITDAEIGQLDKNNSMKQWALRLGYVVKHPGMDDATAKRLREEARKCKDQLHTVGGK